MRETSHYMQNKSFAPQTSRHTLPNSPVSQNTTSPGSFPSSSPMRVAPKAPSHHHPHHHKNKSETQDNLTRIFNTALISSQSKEKRNLSSELYGLTESPAFKAVLNAVRQLARVQGTTERQAAEQVIQTFRKMDEIWNEYVFREGLERLRSPRSKPQS